jgi:tRNA dimethylallyltransferase
VLLIAGPTASGKSALALDLAERLGGEIVGADSMQVYRDLRVLTARPSPQDEARVPHHLIGLADGAESWSVGHWLRLASEVLAGIAERGRIAIVVGGTGLYFRALTHGLADIPEVPHAAREAAEARFDTLGEPAFRAELGGLDAASASAIAANDRQRLVRAMAVAVHTGTPLSRWRAESHPLLAAGTWRGLVLEPPREALYARCDARLAAMLDQGALDEVRALVTRALPAKLPIMKAVGVREFAAYLAGEISLADAVAQAQQATRNYAKRQLTWFRNQTPDWPRIADAADPQAHALLGRALLTR